MSKERYTIGRLPDNDVRIDNPAVSGHHSLIINILNDSFLEDLNSTNGTYVNGKLIKKHALQHGDVITIGHHQLRFADDRSTEKEQDEFEKTMVIPAGQQNAEQLAKAEAAADRAAARRVKDERVDVKVEMPEPERKKAAPASPRPSATVTPHPHTRTATGIDPSNAPQALPLAKLQVLSGAFAGRELELTKALTTLGRPGVQVAAITRRKEGYFIVNVESSKDGGSPLVNGQSIGQQARKLADNDVVQIAGVKMGFFVS
ncbi:MAG: FHA domain-containing protein [Gammaproteobacteria bacterium]|nr:FHA domain-containing protein [Gammaproteobacteria bacterium]MDH4254449.1 FHA domain-containing protein [Gammaproteobacteria bacterium]MDH5309404.1 FHA domain-containing protein [Gammaproteobacteria bacterium]